ADPLVLNAEADPPDVELREAVDARGGERHPIVGPNGARQSVLAKETIEDGADPLALGGEQAVAAEEVARVLVRDRQRIAIDTIAGPEVSLEVRRPEVVRLVGRRGHDSRVRVVAPAAPFLDQSSPRQKVAHPPWR